MSVVAVKKPMSCRFRSVEGSLMDYPYATCCGLNDEVAHAFPRHVILKDGDLLKGEIWSVRTAG